MMTYLDGKVKCNDLYTDYSYQRSLDEPFVKKIVTNWDERQVRPLTVSMRPNGDLYVIDGQHTAAAAMQAVGPNVKLPARIYTGLTKSEESKLFHELNTNARKPRFNDRVKALYTSGDKRIVAYVNTLNASGAPWSFTQGGGKSTMFTAHCGGLELFDRYGDLLAVALRAVYMAGDRELLNAKVTGGVCRILKHSSAKPEDITKALHRTTWGDLQKRFRFYGGDSGGHVHLITEKAFALAILDCYNHGRRKRIRLNTEED